MKPERNQIKGLWPFLAVAALLMVLLAQPALADDLVVDGGATRILPPSISYDNETIGDTGQGTLLHFSGSNTVNSDLILGSQASGSGIYTLFSGSLAVGGNEGIGTEGTGSFTQFGGSHTANQYLSLGISSSGRGTYKLFSGSLVTLVTEVGRDGTGSFSQFGGSHTIYNNLIMGRNTGSSGTYHLYGGSLWANYESLGDGDTGVFKQMGGTHTVNGDLDLGKDGSGTYNLLGGSLAVGHNEGIGHLGTGHFIQIGGAHTVNQILFLGYVGNGTYQQYGGSLSVGSYEYIGYFGIGSFTQTGGRHLVADTLTLAKEDGSSGTYNLQGGQLAAGNIQINPGGTFNVMNTITTVTGDVVNDGTVKTTNAIVTWDGNFTNNAAYISDPSIQIFTGDLEVGADGYLVGASQDLFVVKGDFINQSENTDDWDTAQATLKFATDEGGDTEHNFYIPGEDNDKSGINAFVWGTLNIAGQTVQLLDGNEDASGALYVGGLLGACLSGDTVTNIFGDDALTLNIYYDPDLLVNFYLGGQT
jgi:hypothetical protein